jgi:PAS domain S-box-containing protein
MTEMARTSLKTCPELANENATASPEPINILHIDDDEDQRAFLKVFVEGDDSIRVTSTSDPETVLELASTGAYDCLVSDYDMPLVNGVELAKRVRERSRIPIIIYTGKGSEEIAEAAFAAGIDEYIRKEDSPAHYQVMRKRIRHVVEERRNEESYRNVFENAGDAIFIHTLDGELLDVNDVACQRLRYSKLEILGRSIRQVISSHETFFQDHMANLLKNGFSTFESEEYTSDGEIILVEVSARVIKYRGLDAILSFSRDISERKQQELKSRTRLEALLKHASQLVKTSTIMEIAESSFDIMGEVLGFSDGAFGVVDGDCLRYIYANHYPVEEIPVMPLWGKGISVRAARTRKSQLVPDTSKDPDFARDVHGDKVYSELDVPVLSDSGVVAVINLERPEANFYSDEDRLIVEILARHVSTAISRINQINEIKESERAYQKLLDSSLEPLALISGTSIIYANQRFVDLLGYLDSSEIIGEDFSIMLPKEEQQKFVERELNRQRGGEQPHRYELKLCTKTGKVMSLDVTVDLVDHMDKPAILIHGRDMTQVNRYKRQVTALHKFAAMIAEADSKDELMHLTLDTVESVIGFHWLSLMVPDGDSLVVLVCRGFPSSDIRLNLRGSGLTVKSFNERRSILVVDTQRDECYVVGAVKSRSELDVPVVVADKVVAVINIESAETGAFDELDQQLLETIAGHYASASERILRKPTKML